MNLNFNKLGSNKIQLCPKSGAPADTIQNEYLQIQVSALFVGP